MASTNHTANYNLSQYVSTDKPTYLVDYNNDMLAIDTQMKANATAIGVNAANITTAQTTADNAEIHAQSGISNAATAQTTADGANAKIGTMANLTTSDKSTLVGAVNEVNYNLGLINFNHFETFNNSVQFNTSGITFEGGELTVASNEDGSMCKIYGEIAFSSVSQGSSFYVQSRLRPSQDITINGCCLLSIRPKERVTMKSYTIKTDGKILFDGLTWYYGGSDEEHFLCLACVIQVKDFGDQPVPVNP